MIKLNRINKHRVKAIPIPNEDRRPIRGFEIVEEPYANIFLCAKKNSGKTSATFKILKECSGQNTKIIVFCSTAYKDKNWIQIRKYFKKKGIDIQVFTSIYDGGQDQLANLIQMLKQEAKDAEDGIDDSNLDGKSEHNEEDEHYGGGKDSCDLILEQLEQMHLAATGGGYHEMEKAQRNMKLESEKKSKNGKGKEKKSKFLEPEYMIIFDDLSSELKSPSLLSLLKFNRHFKAKLIISSQWIHDLLPESRKQIDLFLIFKGFPVEKLKEIYKDCDSGVDFDTFYKIYKKATKRDYAFMYIDTRKDCFRRNFNDQIIIKKKSNSHDSDSD
jgi:hypothetical protein